MKNEGMAESFLLSPPKKEDTVDALLLAVEIVVCLTAGGLLYMAANKAK